VHAMTVERGWTANEVLYFLQRVCHLFLWISASPIYLPQGLSILFRKRDFLLFSKVITWKGFPTSPQDSLAHFQGTVSQW